MSIPLQSCFFSYCFQPRASLVWLSSSHFNKYAVIRVSRDCFLDKSHNHVFNLCIIIFNTLQCICSNKYLHPHNPLNCNDNIASQAPSFFYWSFRRTLPPFLQFLWDFCFVPHKCYSLGYFGLISRLKTCLLTPQVRSNNLYQHHWNLMDLVIS